MRRFLSARSPRLGPVTFVGACVLALTTLNCNGDDVAVSASYGIDVRPEASPCRGPIAPRNVKTTRLHPEVSFDRPTRIAQAGAGRPFFVLEQSGKIRTLGQNGETAVAFDMTPYVLEQHREGGLLGIAFSPAYEASGEIFVSYTASAKTEVPAGHFRFVVSRVRPAGSSEVAGPIVEEVLSIDREEDFHNGGALAFGRDGFLYVSTGDGAFGDPLRRAPDPSSLLGKILRIDVMGTARPYAIPPGNPFVEEGRAEVWATGFRNPWTMSFGPTGRLWVGDVGHFRWEEIDLVERGKFYGWPDREATRCTTGDVCSDAGERPIVEYSHAFGLAVTGGYEYRGTKIPSLVGTYVYGDYVSGHVWSVRADDPARPAKASDVADTGLFLSAIGEDSDGEIVVADYVGGGIYRLEQGEGNGLEETASLASLGCTDGRGEMDARLVPYDVAAPLWSDGLAKRRWISVPAGASVTTGEDGSFVFPPATVLLKEFSFAGKKIETRMMVNDAERGWLGYTFAWNDAGTDATLLREGKTVLLPSGAAWDVPGRSACSTCHNKTAGEVLGFRRAQLQRSFVYANGRTAAQMETLAHVGIVSGVDLSTPFAGALVDPYTAGPSIELRARSYLDGNCAHCHNTPDMDLRASTPLAEAALLCRLAGVSNIPDAAEIVRPGLPEYSVLVRRLGHTSDLRMPPLGTRTPDLAAVDLVSRWIGELRDCP